VSKKPLTEEQKIARRKAVKEYNQRNPGVTAAKKKRYNKRKPEKVREKRLIKRYGLTIAMYDEMVLIQESKCAICNQVPDRKLVVDHNHSTNKVRSLLCDHCNQGIGLLKENIEILTSAINYLRKWNCEK
jgi:hypothetical protein